MNLPDIKQLKKLADACRKAGIKHFKSPEFEFTLTEDAPVKQARQSKGAAPKASHSDTGEVETSGLSPEELMFWSSPIQTEEKAEA